MTWEDRIKLSLKMIEDVHGILKDDSNGNDARMRDMDELKSHINGMKQYIADRGIADLNPAERRMESILILRDVIETVYPRISQISEEEHAAPTYMTYEEARKKLVSDYMECMNCGSEEVAGMSVSEWLEENGIVIVNDDEMRRISREMIASSSDDVSGAN